jgi:hypothetical protein
MNRWRLALRERQRFGFVYAREPMVHLCCDAFLTTRVLPSLSLQHLSQWFATEALLLLMRKLADGEIYFLLGFITEFILGALGG